MAPMRDFFVSFNKADRAWAEWIAWQLEEAEYTTYFQEWDFRAGGNFVLDMQNAAARATRTIAVLSPAYLASRFTQPEWAAAFANDPTGEKGSLVPVRVQDCDPQGMLRVVKFIDLVGLDEDIARHRLIEGVDPTRPKPIFAPTFPPTSGPPPGGDGAIPLPVEANERGDAFCGSWRLAGPIGLAHRFWIKKIAPRRYAVEEYFFGQLSGAGTAFVDQDQWLRVQAVNSLAGSYGATMKLAGDRLMGEVKGPRLLSMLGNVVLDRVA
jgi:TIR domain